MLIVVNYLQPASQVETLHQRASYMGGSVCLKMTANHHTRRNLMAKTIKIYRKRIKYAKSKGRTELVQALEWELCMILNADMSN